jgi:hypothetical protein
LRPVPVAGGPALLGSLSLFHRWGAMTQRKPRLPEKPPQLLLLMPLTPHT